MGAAKKKPSNYIKEWVDNSPVVTVVVTVVLAIGSLLGLFNGALSAYSAWMKFQDERQQPRIVVGRATLLDLQMSWEELMKRPGYVGSFPLAERIFRDDPNVTSMFKQRPQNPSWPPGFQWSDIHISGIAIQIKVTNPTSSSITVHSCIVLLHRAKMALDLYVTGASPQEQLKTISPPLRIPAADVVDQMIIFPLLTAKDQRLGTSFGGDNPESLLRCLDHRDKAHEVRFPFSMDFRS
ncbi:MAG: hypothetical protein IT513_13295 [Burkholderiales bacterium]|nr:hypothetical protein [Burkholderiales bacterium]